MNTATGGSGGGNIEMIEGALPQLTNEQNDSTTNTTIYEMDDDTDQLTV